MQATSLLAGAENQYNHYQISEPKGHLNNENVLF